MIPLVCCGWSRRYIYCRNRRLVILIYLNIAKCLVEKLVENLCGQDPLAYVEAEQVALAAMNARIEFWNKLERKLFE